MVLNATEGHVYDAPSNRDNHIDSVCGLLIIYMILYHIVIFCGVEYFWSNRYLFFFMPWFFFKAGMFYKERTIVNELRLTVKKFINPFLLFSLLGWAINSIGLILAGDDNIRHFFIAPIKHLLNEGSIDGNKPLWFLLSLFLVRNIYSLLSGLKNGYISFAGIVFFCIVVFVWNVEFPLWISNTICGLFFFCSGKILKQIQYENVVFIGMLCLYLFTVVFLPSIVDMRTCKLIEGYFPIWMISSIAGCVCANYVIKKTRSSVILSYIGRNSLFFFITHWIVLYTVKILYTQIAEKSNISVYFFLLTASCLFVLPITLIVYKHIVALSCKIDKKHINF